jgi:NADH:ubiquinone oxidoreductase subunit H
MIYDEVFNITYCDCYRRKFKLSEIVLAQKYVWCHTTLAWFSFIFIACLAETNRAPLICLKLKLN